MLVLAITAGVLVVRMFIKNNVHVGPNGEVFVQMPGGATMRTGKAKDIGIPIYPGPVSSGTGMEVTSLRQDQNMSMATYFSTDAVEKVDDWYRENLSKDYIREGPGEKRTIPSGQRFPVPIQTNSITYVSIATNVPDELKGGPTVRVVALTQVGASTQIVLMITGAPATQ